MAAVTYILCNGAAAMTPLTEVARSAPRISLALRERAGARETVMAAAPYIL
jgi:hypothetical protein